MASTMISPNEPLFKITTSGQIDESIIAEEAKRIKRGHLGFSVIGKPDDRTLWFKFRWSLPDDFSAQSLRIFSLGHVIEEEVIKHLRMIPGMTVINQDENGNQFNYSMLGGHFGGSQDGACLGVPEAPKTWHLLEVKSANEKQFKEAQTKGIKAWKIEYWTQAQCYMGASGLTRTLFAVYNKNTSELYCERIELDKMIYPAMVAKARRLIDTQEPPVSSYPKREYYEARFMSDRAQAIYWGDELPVSVNCRNCRHSTPVLSGEGAKWMCNTHNCYLTIEKQHIGCESHNWLPSLVPAILVGIHSNCVEYQTADGYHFWNVPHNAAALGQQAYSSKELMHLSRRGLRKDVLSDEGLNQLRITFNAPIELIK